MDKGEFLYYLNWILKVIFVLLLLYFLYVLAMYITGILSNIDSSEDVILKCNSFAEAGDDYDYCCRQFNIYYNENIIGSSCYGLVDSGLIDAVRYECGGVTCQDGS